MPPLPQDPDPIGGGWGSGAGAPFNRAEHDPLILDLSGVGIQILSHSIWTPYFDFTGSGFAQNASWTGSGSAFLALPGADGLVHNGADLVNTFAQIQNLDTNGDGTLSADDTGFAQLRVWQDLNNDGVCQTNEMLTLSQAGIASFLLATLPANIAIGDSRIEETATVTMADGSTHEIAQVSLGVSSFYTAYVGPYTLNSATTVLPDVKGYGTLPTLSIAMSLDPALLATVQTFQQAPAALPAGFDASVQAIMYAWAGAETVSPTSGGAFDGQKLAFLEAFTGLPGSFVWGGKVPWLSDQVNFLQQSWDAAFSGFKARLLTQLPGSVLSADFSYIPSVDLIVPNDNISTVVSEIASQAPADSASAITYWSNALLVISESASDLGQYLPVNAATIAVELSAAAPPLFSPVILQAAAAGKLSYVEGACGLPQIGGTPGSDLFVVAQPNLTATGFGGGDEFVVSSGCGTLTINETDASPQPDNVLLLGAEFASADVTVSVDQSGDVVLMLDGAGDRVVLTNMLRITQGGMQYGVQQVRFADGTVWSVQQLVAQQIMHPAGADTLYGSAGADVLDGKGGNDLAIGNGGNDAFVFNPGYGSLEIKETDPNPAADNELLFGTGIDASQVSVTGDSSGNLVLTVGGNGDRVVLDGMLNQIIGGMLNGVQVVRFADGTLWTAQAVIALAAQSATAAQRLVGTAGPDRFDAPGSSVYEQGKGGGDTFVFDSGYGALEINEADSAATPANVLQLGAGISNGQVTARGSQTGAVILSDGTAGDQIALDNMLNGPKYGVQSVQFASGEIWSWQQVISRALTGSAGNDWLFGTPGADVIDGHGGTDYAQGNGGGDTFIFNPGYGTLDINEIDWGANPANILRLGAGIAEAQLAAVSDASGNLILTDGVAGDQIKLDTMLIGPHYGVQALQLADGTLLSRAQVIALATSAGPGTTRLYGSPGAEVFNGHGYATYEQGGGGGDTFVFTPGDGPLEIDESDANAAPANVLQFAAGIAPADVVVRSDSADNIFLTDATAGDQIKLDFMLSGRADGVQSFAFADGTIWSRQQVIDAGLVGAADNTRLYGSPEADTFDSNGYQAYELGGGGNDTFVFKPGYGAVEINEADARAFASNTLQFGAGITPGMVRVTGDSAGDIILSIGSGGDRVTLDRMLNGIPYTGTAGTQYGVQAVSFVDGTSWSAQQVLAMEMTAAPGAASLYGTLGPDRFDSRGYATYEQGNGGADTFIYDSGYGALEINAYSGDYSTTAGVLQLGADISQSQVTVSADSSGAIYLADGGSGDRIKLDGMLNQNSWSYYAYGIGLVQFADGTSWTRQQVYALSDIGSAINMSLYGTPAADTFDSRGYATYEQGNGGADTFVYNPGYGALEVNEYAGNFSTTTAVLRLGSGISQSQVAVSGDSSGNLYLTGGTAGDQIKLDRMLNQNNWGYNAFGVAVVQFADGSTLTRQQLINLVTTGVPGRTSLYGTAGADVFDSRGYASYEQGNGGTDSFIYNPGYGALEINEYAGDFSTTTAALQLGAGISQSQLAVSADSSGNIYLTDGTSGDRIKLDGLLNQNNWGYNASGVATVQFADGSSLTRQQVDALADIGSPSNTSLYGTPTADTFDSRGYATFEQGNGGGDTFIYNPGYGALEINEYAGNNNTTAAVLQLGAGISQLQVATSADSAGNIYLTDGTGGDQVKLDGMLNQNAWGYNAYGVAVVQFADGSSLTRQQLINLDTTGVPGRASLYGTAGADVFDSRGYANYAQGNGGADTFIYNTGYAVLEINEYAGNSSTTAAVLQLGAGISQSQVAVSADSSGNIYLTDGTSGDRVKLDGMLNQNNWGYNAYAVASVQFADGTSWTRQQVDALADIGSASNTKLYGTPTADTFDSRGYASYAQGNGGADTFIYNPGYGALEINEYAGNNSTTAAVLRLGIGISQSQVSVSADSSGAIYLTDGTSGDRVKLDGMLYQNNWGYYASGVGLVQFADGTSWTRQQVATLVDIGSPSNTKLYGTQAADTFDSRGYAGYAQGNGGADTFIYNPGYGALEIDEYAGNNSTTAAVLRLGIGISQSQVSVSADSSGAIYLTDGTSGDRVKLDGMLYQNNWGYYASGVGLVQLADGTSWTRQQVATLVDIGSPSNTKLYGTQAADTFDSRGYASYAQGNGGADTFIYNPGYGALEINEYAGNNSTTAAVLQLGAGISPSQVGVSADSSGNIYLSDAAAGDRVKLDGMLYQNSWGYYASGVGMLQFADGTSCTRQQVAALADIGSPGNTKLYGTQGADTFDSRGYATYAQGNGGADTFIYNPAYGALEINEDVGNYSTTAAMLQLGSGISQSQLTVSADGSSNIYLTDGASGDQVKLDRMLTQNPWGYNSYGVAVVQFADGSSWNLQQLRFTAAHGTFAGDTILGTTGSDLLDGRGGTDTLIGNGGTDTYLFRAGYGHLTIENVSTATVPTGQLLLGAGLTDEGLWFMQSGNDLQINALGTQDEITIQGWFGANVSAQLVDIATADGLRVDSAVSQLVAAMASYTVAHPGFDATAAGSMPTDSSLQSTLNASWHH